MTNPDPIRSLAGQVLAGAKDPTDEEIKSLAGSVLSNDKAVDTRHTKEELQAMLKACEGREGYRERAEAIKAKLSVMDDE